MFTPETAATTALCLMVTPFGGPPDPDVYIMQHRSSGDGGVGSVGFSSPSLRRSSNLRTVIWSCEDFRISKSSARISSSLAVLSMMCSILFASLRVWMKVCRRWGSMKIAFAFVDTREC